MPSSSRILAMAALGSAANAVRVNSAPYNAVLLISAPSNETIATTTVEITTTLTTTPAATVTLPPLSEVTVCPQPTGIAQNEVPEPNMQYGCSPGFVCDQPKPEECNVWPGLPSQDFTCDPTNCIQAPPLPEQELPEGEIGYIAPAYGYFDLNPEIFGLSYDIFAYHLEEQVINGQTVTVTTGNWAPTAQPRPTGVVRRQLRQTFPMINKRQGATGPSSQCYGICTGSARLAQQAGLEPDLCTEDRWLNSYNRCVDCILAAGAPRETIRRYVEPQFARYLTYCFGDFVTNPVNATSTASVPADAITSPATFDTDSQLPAESTGFVDTPTDISTEVTTTEDISTGVSTSTSISSGASSSEATVTTITTIITETQTSAVTEVPGTVTTSFSTSLPPFPTPVPTPTPGVPAAAVRVTASSTFAAILLGIAAMLL